MRRIFEYEGFLAGRGVSRKVEADDGNRDANEGGDVAGVDTAATAVVKHAGELVDEEADDCDLRCVADGRVTSGASSRMRFLQLLLHRPPRRPSSFDTVCNHTGTDSTFVVEGDEGAAFFLNPEACGGDASVVSWVEFCKLQIHQLAGHPDRKIGVRRTTPTGPNNAASKRNAHNQPIEQ